MRVNDRGEAAIDNEAIVGGLDPEARKRLDISQLAAALAAARDENPKDEALLKRLEEPVAMPFAKPTPLSDVIKYLKSQADKSGQSPLPIYLDPKGLQDQQVTPASTVTIDLEGAPLKTSLRLLLKQLGLAYCIRDGVVIISSVQGIREELAEAAGELVGSGNQEIDYRMLWMTGILGRGSMGPPGGMMGSAGSGGMR